MTVEYVLLLSLFVTLMMGTLLRAPTAAFKNAAPKLGARVERHLMTGDGFKRKGGANNTWIEK
jgi:hypothetical protein